MPIGTNFDDFLKEEGIYESCTAAATKKVIALKSDEDTIKNNQSEASLQPENQTVRQEGISPFLYLGNIQKNLVFLYRYCDVVASMRLIGFHDQIIAQAISDCCASEFERLSNPYFKPDPNVNYGNAAMFERGVTVGVVCELGIFGLAELMLKFLESDKKQLLGRVTGNKYFCDEVISVFYDLSKISIEEREKTRVEALENINNGYQQRGDTKDKARLAEWAQTNKIVVRNVNELFEKLKVDSPLKGSYRPATLKSWYLEACPDVKLSGGRPKKNPNK